MHQDHIHGWVLVKSGSEPETLLPLSRDLTTRPPLPCYHNGVEVPGYLIRPRRPSSKAGGFKVRKPIPLKISRVFSLLHIKSYVGGKRTPDGVNSMVMK
ncbi:hypothetical protein AVEN_193162-1 [Araneus ventricosus]|uniref:Uncharacterized protein n=1 Tax=Araneus ventricosus TaxID=182803 RepID=A0A4Y2B048_ARAVE|nr:hypothetical protein AVEN_193162-1 [Araneus ventricosus]